MAPELIMVPAWLAPIAARGDFHIFSRYEIVLGTLGKIKYQVGWLLGATDASPRGTLRRRLELEIRF
jgi:hypothetical protein